ncbi:hypothetical protein [Methanospirillum sp.]|uniref:hypothetical protein n=1 Tax=Methanospirillum sp. TaxID=45200 RepID=UPI00359F3BDA
MNFHYVKSAMALFLFILICAPVSAYYLSIDAPTQVKVGESILVSGSTNTPPPDRIDIVFSHSLNVPLEVDRKSIQITEKGDTYFNVTFDTNGLEKGNYKIEGLSQSQRAFSAGSRSIRVVKLIDRSDMITINSPTWQEFEKTLLIEAKISGYSENAIQMEVTRENETVFGPESIPVSGGRIKYELPVQNPGTYDISFSDYDGFIGKYSIVLEEKDQHRLIETVENHELTAALIKDTEKIETVKETPIPTSGEPKKISGITAEADVSRDNPGFFTITTDKTPITIQVAGNSDLVFEYKTSPDAANIKVNEEMSSSPETVTITDVSSEIYLKVYPYSFKAAERATITADIATSIVLSDTAAKTFGFPPRYGNSEENDGTKTPISAFSVLFGLISGLMIFIKRN